MTTAAEIDYCKMLNSVLPEHIQVVAWAPCARRDFSARFDCVGRTYKYFFPRGGLDLGAMNEAGESLVGEHDFRNFCKMDARPRRLDPLHTPSPRLGRLKRRSCT